MLLIQPQESPRGQQRLLSKIVPFGGTMLSRAIVENKIVHGHVWLSPPPDEVHIPECRAVDRDTRSRLPMSAPLPPSTLSDIWEPPYSKTLNASLKIQALDPSAQGHAHTCDHLVFTHFHRSTCTREWLCLNDCHGLNVHQDGLRMVRCQGVTLWACRRPSSSSLSAGLDPGCLTQHSEEVWMLSKTHEKSVRWQRVACYIDIYIIHPLLLDRDSRVF